MNETGEIADAISACVVETMTTSTEEIVESSFYVLGMKNVIIFLIIIFTLSIIFRLIILFIKYIKVGKFGNFEDDSFVYNTLEGNFVKILPALTSGIHPGSILTDILGFTVISLVAGLLWPALAILPIIGVAYLIRLPIARKQEFIAKLDGTYNEGTNEEDNRP